MSTYKIHCNKSQTKCREWKTQTMFVFNKLFFNLPGFFLPKKTGFFFAYDRYKFYFTGIQFMYVYWSRYTFHYKRSLSRASYGWFYFSLQTNKNKRKKKISVFEGFLCVSMYFVRFFSFFFSWVLFNTPFQTHQSETSAIGTSVRMENVEDMSNETVYKLRWEQSKKKKNK